MIERNVVLGPAATDSAEAPVEVRERDTILAPPPTQDDDGPVLGDEELRALERKNLLNALAQMRLADRRAARSREAPRFEPEHAQLPLEAPRPRPSALTRSRNRWPPPHRENWRRRHQISRRRIFACFGEAASSASNPRFRRRPSCARRWHVVRTERREPKAGACRAFAFVPRGDPCPKSNKPRTRPATSWSTTRKRSSKTSRRSPGEKALVTFHTVAFEGSIGLVNLAAGHAPAAQGLRNVGPALRPRRDARRAARLSEARRRGVSGPLELQRRRSRNSWRRAARSTPAASRCRRSTATASRR